MVYPTARFPPAPCGAGLTSLLAAVHGVAPLALAIPGWAAVSGLFPRAGCKYMKETDMDKIRYDYRHPVFYSRKHPFYAKSLDKEVRGALVAALAPTSPPF